MFRITSFILTFCLLVQSSTCSASGKLQNASFNSALGDKIPQSVDQTFNINNWGLGKIERKLLTDIKAKIDVLFNKGKFRFECKFNLFLRYGEANSALWFSNSCTVCYTDNSLFRV